MKKFRFCIVIICCCCLISCKSSYTAINDKKEGIIINLPKGSVPITPDSLENQYSGEFYRVTHINLSQKVINEVFTWDYIYQVSEDIVVGFEYIERRVIDASEMKKERGAYKYANKELSDGTNYSANDVVINNRLFWLDFRKVKDNDADYFVSFKSDMTKANGVWGKIRFPASYPLEEIEKQTTKILSGIKFQF
ncbi:hypothetical protein [Viscerimonas tarda]